MEQILEFLRSFNVWTVLIRLVLCVVVGGIIGMDAACVVRRMRTRITNKFVKASGVPRANGVIFTLDTTSKKVTQIERITF